MSNKLQPSQPKLERRPYGLGKAIDCFCRHIALGVNQSESYRLAYPKAKTQNPHRLLKRQDVIDRIKFLRSKKWEENALGVAEKRDFLARAVRTPISEIDATSDLAQKIVVDKDGGIKIESVGKLAALAEDSKLAGDYFADQTQNAQNSFGFLIGFMAELNKLKPPEKDITPKEIEIQP